MRQNTEWGYIDWEYLPDSAHPGRWFNFGKVTILPGRTQPLHVHYGNEQFLYVKSGEAVTKFNGKEYHPHAGDYFLLESNTTHETYNPGPEPYVEYMVANPLPGPNEPARIINKPVTLSQGDEEQKRADFIKLNLAAENLKNTILSNVSVHVCLADTDNNIILRNFQYPEYCLAKCDPVNSPACCDCYNHQYIDKDAEFTEQPSPYVCAHGMQLFWFPVFLRDRVIGTLRGGRHYSSQHTNSGFDPSAASYYDTPYSTQHSISNVVKSIAESITGYCETLESVEELDRQKDELNSYMAETDTLRQNLSDIEEKVTNLRIDHHFLFNTLNCLANMSLTSDRMDIYKGILDLSRMFRYTMAQDSHATLEEELGYLRSYMDLQSLRFRERLVVEYDIDPDCLDVIIPFNFLQPVAENAFTHAFLDFEGTRRIWVSAKRHEDKVVIVIENNGTPPDPGDTERISLAWANGSGHGLSFIFDKLKSSYGDDFSMSFAVTPENNTQVSITIPA